MKPKKIYICIPYTGMELLSFETANQKASELMAAGHIVFSPISHSHPMTVQCNLPKDFEYWKAWNFSFIDWCDDLLVVKLDGWEASKGVKAEIYYAMCTGKPVIYTDKFGGKSMKSLEEFNKDQRERTRILNDPCANGIGCPECGKELWDSNPDVMLTSYPPQKNVHCPECGYTGYRIA